VALTRGKIAEYRDNAEEEAGKHGESEREADGAGVEGDFAETRQVGGADLGEQAEAGPGDRDADGTADEAEGKALEQ